MIRLLDLFAGAGGMTLGFVQAGLGFHPVQAAERDTVAALTYRNAFGCQVTDGSVGLLEHFEGTDVLLGRVSQPKRSTSSAGADRELRCMFGEPWEQCLAVARRTRPVAFVLEGSSRFFKSGRLMPLMVAMGRDAVLRDYGIALGVLEAARYGVPQFRQHGVLIAVRGMSEVPWPPPATHGKRSPQVRPLVTVADAFEGLPQNPAKSDLSLGSDGWQDLHFTTSLRLIDLERYKVIPQGGNRFDLAYTRPDLTPRAWLESPTGREDVLGRLYWNRPSTKITKRFTDPEKGRFLHPIAHRPITHREAARLQSFPDDFQFTGDRQDIARQIGTAMPPLLARAVAEHLYSVLESRGSD
ncbi:DNA cytosine methyltransferase [Geodermatophilus sp. SYSU D00710]